MLSTSAANVTGAPPVSARYFLMAAVLLAGIALELPRWLGTPLSDDRPIEILIPLEVPLQPGFEEDFRELAWPSYDAKILRLPASECHDDHQILVSMMARHAAGSGMSGPCRVIVLPPGSGPEALLHELGHHAGGEAGLPRWPVLSFVLNAIFDLRVEFVYRLRRFVHKYLLQTRLEMTKRTARNP